MRNNYKIAKCQLRGKFRTVRLLAIALLPAVPSAAVTDSSGETWFARAHLPQPVRTILVTDTSELRSALAEAEPGDHIVLADGTYEAATMARDGTPADPIVVRAENLHGARFVNTLSFRIVGSHFILHGADFVNTAVDVGFNRQTDNVMIWRCRFRDNPPPSTQISLRLYVSRNTDIAYNEWVNWAGRGVSAGVFAGARDFTIRRNLFRDQPNQRGAGGTGAQYNATEAIQVGFGESDLILDSGARLEYNRFYNWFSDDEVISIKSSNVVVFRNSFEESTWVSNRFGINNVYEANEIRNGWGFMNFDGPNLYKGNAQFLTDTSKFPLSMSFTEIKPGNTPAGMANPPQPFRPASEDVVMVGNHFDTAIRIGRPWGGETYPVKNLIIRESHIPEIIFDSNNLHEDPDIQPDEPATGHTWAERIWLEDEDVGPFADPADSNGSFFGYPIDENGWADTGDYMGFVYAESAPWVYSYTLARWLYASVEAGNGEGIWFWVFR